MMQRCRQIRHCALLPGCGRDRPVFPWLYLLYPVENVRVLYTYTALYRIFKTSFSDMELVMGRWRNPATPGELLLFLS